MLADADDWLAPDGAFVTLLARKQVADDDLEVLAADEDDAVVAHRPLTKPHPLAVVSAQ